jgi:fido (protein-threonine AMPylation protein)
MTTPSEKLAESLKLLHDLQQQDHAVIRSSDLTRTHRERLSKNGFLQEVIKGWYIATQPEENTGESTAWYASYWPFCAAYLRHLKGDDWCLSPEQSLSLHADNWTVPKQLLVRAAKARNNITSLPYGTSLLDIRASLPKGDDIVEKNGLRLFSLAGALIACSPGYFRQSPMDMRAALSMVRDASEVLEKLLDGGHSIVAGRLAGAFRNIGYNEIAENIVQTMRAAGYDIRESDPFEAPSPILFFGRAPSPYVSRIRLMWQTFREPIIKRFPVSPGKPQAIEAYLKSVDDIYVTDAYNSLSIEGYRVSPELIERVRSGNWDPDADKHDNEQRNALAARGYWQSYKAVKESIRGILGGENAGDIVERDHRIWYRELFTPGITAGLLRPGDLAGYRNSPVYIRRSMHVPPSREAVRDSMPMFFQLLKEEPKASVRVVLGHFIFVYIHPYMDGNGRIGRFLMNAMLAAGGYPWTVIPLERREQYMSALESASVEQNIAPFTDFLANLIEAGVKPAAPKP